MIHQEQSSLADDKERELRIWMSKAPSEILDQIIRSKVALHQARALESAVGSKDVPENLESSVTNNEMFTKGQIIAAQRYQIFLEIWDEIRKQEEPFTLTRLSC